MSKFQVGDCVWISGHDCYGYVVDVDEDSYDVEITTTVAIGFDEYELEAVK